MLRIDSASTTDAAVSVILVGDDVSLAETYRLGLERHGFEVTIARSDDGLFDALETRLPDIVLLDHELPAASAAQVLEIVRRQQGAKPVRMFVLTEFPPGDQGAVAWLDRTTISPKRLAITLAELSSDGRQTSGGALRLRVSQMDSLEELSGWLGTFRERRRRARSADEAGVAAVVTELEARYRQRRAELA